MNYVGDYNPGQIVYIYFNTFTSNDPSASATITNFVDTDVHIHKDDSLTQRNDTAGVAIDVDVDAITGSHFISIDTSDNTVDDFFVAGHDYFVRIEGTTVDAGTINAVVGSFSLGNRAVAGWMNGSQIATLASQTSFTLSQGSADNDAYNNCTIVVTDQATTVQKCIGSISDYTGATLTVTLAADPGIFTMAAGDNVQIFASSAFANVNTWLGTLVTSGTGGPDVNVNSVSDDTTAAQTLELFVEVLDQADGQIDAGTFNPGAIDAAAIAANAIGSSELATDAIGAAQIAANAIGNSEAAFVDSNDRIDVGSWLGTAVTSGTGGPDVNVNAISDSTEAPINLEASAETIVIGAAEAGTLSTTQMTSDLSEATDDHYNGRIVIWTSGVLQDQASDITDYSGATGLLTYTAVTEAPSAADAFIIV